MSDIPLAVSADDFKRAALSQKDFLEQLAMKIEAGEPITDKMGQAFAAGAVRAFAAQIPLSQKGKQGPAPKFCAGSEAMSYAAARMNPNAPRSHGEALAEIADRVGVSEQAVEKAIKPHRAAAFSLFGVDDPGNKRRSGNQ